MDEKCRKGREGEIGKENVKRGKKDTMGNVYVRRER
jgi:hypothetical protein